MNYPEGADNSKAPWNQEEPSEQDVCPLCGEPDQELIYGVSHWGVERDVCRDCSENWEEFTETCQSCEDKDNNPHCVDEGAALVLCEPCHLSWVFSGDLGEWHELQPKVAA